MNQDRLGGSWKQFSGKVKEGWCKLTNDVPGMAAARREQRAGWIRKGRGVSKETAARRLKGLLGRDRY